MQFGEEEMEIVAMLSLEGEEVPLKRRVAISPDVEVREGGRETEGRERERGGGGGGREREVREGGGKRRE